MHLVVQACILGVLTGGVYALMASGLTLVFGVMRVINVAQGALVILSAYLSWALFTHFQVDPFLSVLIVAPLIFGLGVGVQLVFIRSLRSEQAEELSLLITWALALGIEGVLGAVYETTYRASEPSYANASWTISGYRFSEVRVFAFALSAAVLLLLYLLLARTRFGRSVRATVQNPTSAQLLGVIAAVLMGVVESVVAVEISPVWSSFSYFIVLVAILLVRPQGMFGLRERLL